MIAKPLTEQCILAAILPSDRGRPVSFIECRTCGFEPADQLSTNQERCPKCHGFTWHRVLQTRRSLARRAAPSA